MVTRLRIFSFLLVITLCLGAFSLPASAGNSDWTVTFGPHVQYEEVVYGNGKFVAVGDGLIVSSVDGQKWTVEHAVATESGLMGVAWSGSMYVAVGSGMILTSPDGKNWTERNVDASLYAVGWGNDLFVAVGSGGVIYTSPDGIAWTPRNSDCTEWLMYVEWGNGTFVAGGCETILTSPDGKNWTRHELPFQISRVRWLNGQFFAVNGVLFSEENRIYTSVDGLNWQEQAAQIDCPLVDLAWDGSHYTAVGLGGGACTSPDGLKWTKVDSGTTEPLTSVAWNGKQLVAVGWGVILTSADGIAWTPRISGEYYRATSVTWGQGQFIALGEYQAHSSPDGINWTKEELELSGCIWSGGAWGKDRLLIVSALDYECISYTYIYDGTRWISSTRTSTEFVDVAWGNDRFVAVGYQCAYTSLDGRKWDEQKIDDNRLYAIIWAKELFVAVGDLGAILTSPDGKTWTRQSSGVEENLYGITWGNGQFVVVGEKGRVLTSPDGTNWTVHNSITDASLLAATFGSDLFVAVGAEGIIQVSGDGRQWYASPSGVNCVLRDVTWGDGAFAVAGDGLMLHALAESLSLQNPIEEPNEDPDPDEPSNEQEPGDDSEPEEPDGPSDGDPADSFLAANLPWIIGGMSLLALLLAATIFLVIRKKAKLTR